MLAESNKVAIVIEKDSSGGLLVVRVITGIENFNSWFLTWFHNSWSDTVTRQKVRKQSL